MAFRVMPLMAAVLLLCCAAASGARVGPKLDMAANLEHLRVRLLADGDGFGQEGASRGLKQADAYGAGYYGYGYYYGYGGYDNLPPCEADDEETPVRRSLLSAELSHNTRAILDTRSRNIQASKVANKMMNEEAI